MGQVVITTPPLASGAGTGTTWTTTSITTATLSPAAGSLLVLFVRASVPDLDPPTGLSGVIWTERYVRTSVNSSGGPYDNGRIHLWTGQVPDGSPPSGPLTITWAPPTVTQGQFNGYHIIQVTGHNPSDPLPHYADSIASANAVMSLGPAQGNPPADSRVVGFCMGANSAATGTNVTVSATVGSFFQAFWRTDAYLTAPALHNTSANNAGALAVAFEVASLPPVPVTDTDTATFTDAQTDPYVRWTETGRFTESAGLNILGAGDKGTVTEASALLLGKASADTGLFDEAVIVTELPFTTADQAAVTEAAWTQSSVVGGDAGTFADAATVRVDTAAADSGLFTERVTDIGGGTTPVEAADTATFVGEQAVLAVEAEDTATFLVEQGVLDEIVHAVAAADTGQVVESSSVVGGDEYRNAADTATATDSQALQVSVADTDSGAAVDAQADPVDVSYQDRAGAETATAADNATRVGIWSGTDTATATDAESVARFDLRGDGDTATATDDALLVRMAAGDTFSAVDQSTDFFESARTLTGAETGRFRDRLSILWINDPTTGTTDLVADEQGEFVDTGALLVALSDADAGELADTGSLFAEVSGGDGGAVADTVTAITDTVPPAVVVDADSGVLTEAASPFADTADGDVGRLTEDRRLQRTPPPEIPVPVERYLGSGLKANVKTKLVSLSDYLLNNEYLINHPLPVEARQELTAFADILMAPARPGDTLEDESFRYRYAARWITSDRREVGWFLVGWHPASGDRSVWLA